MAFDHAAGSSEHGQHQTDFQHLCQSFGAGEVGLVTMSDAQRD
jgi:hypothetical protein